MEITVTGSTSFRAITIDRAGSLFDVNAAYTAVTNDASVGLMSFRGTVSNAIPSLGATPVTMRLSFSGSGSGMLAVVNRTPVSCAEFPGPGATVNKVPDFALSDVYPGAAAPPITSGLDDNLLGVIPFVYVRNNALTGITNITRDQAMTLMTASGAMPASYLGANNANAGNPIYLTGRDSGSGTRITVHKDLNFIGTPLLWATNGAGAYISSPGLSSGGLERNIISGKSDAIGYLGVADAAAIAGTATTISYSGVAYSESAVANGAYGLWGYEHIVNRTGGMSANQQAIRDALIAAITSPAYQSTPIYTNSFVRLNQMNVSRGADGGAMTSLIW